MTRLAYTALFFVNAILATALRAFGNGFLKHLWSFDTCTDDLANPHCVGNQAVYRASFAMSVFFLIMTAASALSDRGFNNCCCLWCFQLPMYGTLFVGSYVLPNDFFYGFAWVARLSSVVFILLQIFIIIDTTYNVRDFLLEKIEAADADESRSLLSNTTTSYGCLWKSLFLGLIVLSLGGSLVGIGFLYHYFDACRIGTVFTSITLVAVLAISGLSATAWIGAGLLPPAIFALYIVFLAYESLSANPNATCNPFLQYQASSTLNTVVAAIIGAATITWTSWSTAASLIRLDVDDDDDGDENDPSTALVKSDRAMPKSDEVPSWQFHLIMVLGAMYMAMVLTEWDTASGYTFSDSKNYLLDDIGGGRVQDGAAMWVHIASQWFIILLYTWSLVAPHVFPDRTFG
ncbi:Aste57867_19418 [Aphanomyces stellatus]|uniref:Aste57867_19418 protein n=1 Tax=Aphanomyces stellatus TaxID=120398 RepID=A0A485LGR3_9STRA|nr:hypothetical protein As57867_019354 [Aphanomyces stellatus]VFT96132.1 Aste57867_19418 [Aphanomyces stellatus]